MGNALRTSHLGRPAPEEIFQARIAARALARCAAETALAQISIDSAHPMQVVLPPAAVQLLQGILQEMALGRAVRVIPVRAELTPIQAADLLDVSPRQLMSLLESGAIPYRKVGARRRIALDHLMSYKKLEDARRREVSNQLSQQARDLKLRLGY